jgi:hypothetical protein
VAAANFLAEKVDAGELSPDEFRDAFKRVWVWMADEMRSHTALMVQSLREAEEADGKTRDAIGAVALGLAVVLGVAIAALGEPPTCPGELVYDAVSAATVTHH